MSPWPPLDIADALVATCLRRRTLIALLFGAIAANATLLLGFRHASPWISFAFSACTIFGILAVTRARGNGPLCALDERELAERSRANALSHRTVVAGLILLTVAAVVTLSVTPKIDTSVVFVTVAMAFIVVTTLPNAIVAWGVNDDTGDDAKQ